MSACDFGVVECVVYAHRGVAPHCDHGVLTQYMCVVTHRAFVSALRIIKRWV